jgi:hypothetical protein
MASFIASPNNSLEAVLGPPLRPVGTEIGSDLAWTASPHDAGSWSGLAREGRNAYPHQPCLPMWS